MLHISDMAEKPERPESLGAIGGRIKLLREALGQSQQGFSDMTGVGRTAIANYEGATRRPDLDEGLKISAATGVPIDWLYKGTLFSMVPEHIREAIRRAERREEKAGRERA